MRVHLFPVLVALMAIGGATGSSPSVQTQAPSEAVQIDFAGLHDQASSALRMLQVSQERRMALQTVEAAF